jgi:hypothetical protein
MKLLDRLGFPSSKVIEEQIEAIAVAEAPEPVLEEVASVPRQRNAHRALDIGSAAEYLQTAKAVGLDDDLGYILELKLSAVLVDENIRVYDYGKVCRFLDRKLGKEWKWLPLREIDRQEFPGGTWSHEVEGAKRYFGETRYNRPVPLPVLLTVQKIVEKVPEARFFVSGIERDADPFLCVTTKLLHVTVIERWDEPDYRER